MASVKLEELFGEELSRGLRVFTGGRTVVDAVDLKPDETDAIVACLGDTVDMVRRVSPAIAETIDKHKSFFVKAGMIAKALFPGNKPLRYPSEPGSLGVSAIIPQAIKYAATPSATQPAYTDYTTNSWTISLTAGTPAYLFGSSTNWYKASPVDEKHTLLAIPKDGVVEIGTTPSIYQMRMTTEIQAKYSPWAVHPLVDQTIERNKSIFQYNTLGPVIVYPNLGFKWAVMPHATGNSTIRVLGLFFYEHDFLSDLKWVA